MTSGDDFHCENNAVSEICKDFAGRLGKHYGAAAFIA